MTLLAARSLNSWALPKSLWTRIFVLVKYSRIVVPIDRAGPIIDLSYLVKLILAHEHLTRTSCGLSPRWIRRGYTLCGFWWPILLVMVLIVLSLVCCLGPLVTIWGSLSTLILTVRLVCRARLLLGLIWARWSLNNDLISACCGISWLLYLRLRPMLSRIVMIGHGSCILLVVSSVRVILLRFKCKAALKVVVLVLVFLLLQITFEIACLWHLLAELRRWTV